MKTMSTVAQNYLSGFCLGNTEGGSDSFYGVPIPSTKPIADVICSRGPFEVVGLGIGFVLVLAVKG